MTIRLCFWSGPRNISTAMMRAWENRADCAVWDEPFYGPYLIATGLDHPGRDEILANVPIEADNIAQHCSGDAPDGSPLFFQKHMCQHMLPETPLGWMANCRHVFLIRDPAKVAASYAATAGNATEDDLGSARQRELYDIACDMTGRDWPVVEGHDVLENPEGMLRALCDALDVPFDPAMLSWPAGRRDSDGVWAAHWYKRVEASTGFEKPRPSPHSLPDALMPVVEACRPHFEALRQKRITP
jgi:Sulfotransferase domain